MSRYLDSFIETVKNNTTGFCELIRQGLFLLMALGWVALTPEQFNYLMQFVSGVLAFITLKTTMATNKVDQRVDEKVAHREQTGVTGTGSGLSLPKLPPGV